MTTAVHKRPTCVGVYKQGQVQAPNGGLFISRVDPDRTPIISGVLLDPEHIPSSSANRLAVFFLSVTK